jgi:hypothetical protein
MESTTMPSPSPGLGDRSRQSLFCFLTYRRCPFTGPSPIHLSLQVQNTAPVHLSICSVPSSSDLSLPLSVSLTLTRTLPASIPRAMILPIFLIFSILALAIHAGNIPKPRGKRGDGGHHGSHSTPAPIVDPLSHDEPSKSAEELCITLLGLITICLGGGGPTTTNYLDVLVTANPSCSSAASTLGADGSSSCIHLVPVTTVSRYTISTSSGCITVNGIDNDCFVYPTGNCVLNGIDQVCQLAPAYGVGVSFTTSSCIASALGSLTPSGASCQLNPDGACLQRLSPLCNYNDFNQCFAAPSVSVKRVSVTVGGTPTVFTVTPNGFCELNSIGECAHIPTTICTAMDTNLQCFPGSHSTLSTVTLSETRFCVSSDTSQNLCFSSSTIYTVTSFSVTQSGGCREDPNGLCIPPPNYCPVAYSQASVSFPASP